MKSYFISGTDTDVGKTYVTAGLARALVNQGNDVGVMKPFAAGSAQKTGFKSSDSEILVKAAKVNDSEDLVNPQFFSIPAAPYTVSQNLGIKVDVPLVIKNYNKLKNLHEILLVEGMGGIMTPILKNYFVVDLIKELNLDTIVVTRSRIGTVNHTLLTCNVCKQKGVNVKGIIINNFDSDGYNVDELTRDLESLLDIKVLGVIPKIENFDIEKLGNLVSKNIDLQYLE